MTVDEKIQASTKVIVEYLSKKKRDVEEIKPRLRELGFYEFTLDIRESILNTAKIKDDAEWREKKRSRTS